MKTYECNECIKGICYFMAQDDVKGKPQGCLLTKAKVWLPKTLRIKETGKDIIPIWIKIEG